MYRRVPTEDEATVGGSYGGQGTTKGSSKGLTDKFSDYLLRNPRTYKPISCTHIHDEPGGPTINGFTLPRKKGEYRIDWLFIKRMWHFTKLLVKKPSRAGWLYLIMTLFCCLNEIVVYFVGTIPSQYFKVLGDRDSASFWRLLLTSCGTVILAGVVSSSPTHPAFEWCMPPPLPAFPANRTNLHRPGWGQQITNSFPNWHPLSIHGC